MKYDFQSISAKKIYAIVKSMSLLTFYVFAISSEICSSYVRNRHPNDENSSKFFQSLKILQWSKKHFPPCKFKKKIVWYFATLQKLHATMMSRNNFVLKAIVVAFQ